MTLKGMSKIISTAVIFLTSLIIINGLPIGVNMLDLSYLYDDDIVYFPGYPKFKLDVIFKGQSASGVWFTANKFCGPEHSGTHMDAPFHFNEEGWTIDEIPFERFIAPAVVINITEKVLTDRNAAVEVSDLISWEEKYGTIPNGSVIIMYSGFGSKWGNQIEYLGLDGNVSTEGARLNDSAGSGDIKLNFPGFSEEVSNFLVSQRDIVGVGVDTISLDPGKQILFPAHQVLLRENLYGLENLANLEKLPPSGATLYMLPMKIKGGSGAPTRILAKF